jgi:excisionase family DNA binding protein
MSTAQQVLEEGETIPRMLRVGEMARVLHVHPHTLRRWSGSGLIPSYRIGSR